MRIPLLGSWRTALRIARRESRRARGRAALVVAMIAVPVAALAGTAVSYDMFTLTPAEQATRQLGAADALLTVRLAGPVEQDAIGRKWRPAGETSPGPALRTEREMLALLPEGSRVVPVRSGETEFRTVTGGLAGVRTHEMDLADPIHRGRAVLVDGRAPRGPGEVALSAAARSRFGDTIRSLDGARSWTAVGTVEFPDDLGEVVVLAPGPADQGAAQWLAVTPEPVDWAQVGPLNRDGLTVTSRAVLLDPPRTELDEQEAEGLSLVRIVVGLAVLEIVLLAGPAFAIGARRRQRSLALVAANGGSRAHLRRIVLADGLVLGGAGAALGLLLGVVVAVLARPLSEQMLVGARAGGYRFDPATLAGIAVLAVATGLLAAVVPAFAAARADVVTALAGRRGAVRSRRRWLVLGLLLATAGAVVAGLAARRTSVELIVAGLAVTQIGLVLCTPSLVGLVALLGGRLPAAPRIALRDTARNRSAAAPAVSAVMAAVAGTVAIGVYLSSSAGRQELNYRASLPYGHISVTYGPGSPDPVRAAFDRALPGAPLTEITQTVCAGPDPSTACQLIPVRAPAQRCPGEDNPPRSQDEIDALIADPRCAAEHITQGSGFPAFWSVVGGRDAVVALTGATGADLERAVDTLDRGGAVVSDPFLLDDDGLVTVTVNRIEQARTPEEYRVPGYLLAAGPYASGTVLPPVLAQRAGFPTVAAGLVATTPAEPGTAALDRLNADLAAAGAGRATVATGPPDDNDPMLYLLALASTLITLGAAGIATGLAAADRRADLSTLAAVGADPGVRRRLSLSQAGVIAGLGSGLGVAAGLLSGFAVLTAINVSRSGEWPMPTPFPLTVPGTNLLFVLIAPLVAMIGAGLLTRAGLPVERRTIS
ncbi:ABC transporter permease [Actinoplanes sp. TRM 88003]|uniref:ABC transporter permease n=1 Tax=Paractinoplanes aksuensis TaxID=2939490 RepID=A0ABT1DT39_9ACTN|nr:FtsX-like permease family protein [Actinoplanes aksuensis]MCO8274007.1 ABC transporter permease [Actinoplanes aksuensis]